MGVLAIEDAETGEVVELDTRNPQVRDALQRRSRKAAAADSARPSTPRRSTRFDLRTERALHAGAHGLLQEPRAGDAR